MIGEEQNFLTGGQNNYGNKILFLTLHISFEFQIHTNFFISFGKAHSVNIGLNFCTFDFFLNVQITDTKFAMLVCRYL